MAQQFMVLSFVLDDHGFGSWQSHKNPQIGVQESIIERIIGPSFHLSVREMLANCMHLLLHVHKIGHFPSMHVQLSCEVA